MNDDIIDYALPTMEAEKALQRLHQYALNKHYNEARIQAQLAMMRCASAFAALLVMELEQEKNGRN